MLDNLSYSESLLDSSSSTIYALQTEQSSTLTDNISTTSELQISKEEMSSICSHICSQLQSIVKVLADIAHAVLDEKETSTELLDELQNKVQPFLENLDEEMTSSEKTTRWNLDNSRINEKRVEWLLKFHKFQLEMRQILRETSGPIYEDIERVLTLRYRGCSGVKLQISTLETLKNMKVGMERAGNFIRQQRCSAPC